MRKMLKIWAVLMAMALLLTGCGKEARPPKAENREVRIYDVEPQDRRNIGTQSYLNYEKLKQKATEIDNVTQKEDMKHLLEIENLVFQYHLLRVGMFTSIGPGIDRENSPYYSQVMRLSRTLDMKIDYVVLDHWEDVREEIEQSTGDGVTKIVLFNNTYDESLIKELRSGRYMDLTDEMERFGFYDGEKYEQTVLQAGCVEGQQVSVPLLYNVPGMVHGEAVWKENPVPYMEYTDLSDEKVSYSELLTVLNAEMERLEEERRMPFMSSAILEGREPDLFLSAAGMDWEDYENQYELFRLAYEYYQTYEKTQKKDWLDGRSWQSVWAEYLNEIQFSSGGNVDVRQQDLDIEGPFITNSNIADGLMDKTTYFVECSAAENIAFHSVIGLISYRNYYNNYIPESDEIERTMNYWPIGMLQEDSRYAAEPISYAAVVEKGNAELAMEVIQALASKPVAPLYGFSVDNGIREEQLKLWSENRDPFLNIRGIYKANGEVGENWVNEGLCWEHICGGALPSNADKTYYADQLREQLDNVVFAQIPDREILAIWQDTLTEAVASGLSAEAGFELLCERMDEWWK